MPVEESPPPDPVPVTAVRNAAIPDTKETSKNLVVQVGEATKLYVIDYDDTTTLGQIREKLEKVEEEPIGKADRFVVGGAVVAQGSESKLLLRDAFIEEKDGNVKTRHIKVKKAPESPKPVAPPEKPKLPEADGAGDRPLTVQINDAAPTVIKFKYNTETSLSDLRTKLEELGLLDSKDRFLEGDDAIHATAESGTKIWALSQKGAVKAFHDGKKNVTRVVAPTLPGLVAAPKIDETYNKAEPDRVGERTFRSKSGQATGIAESYDALKGDDKRRLLEQCNVFRGLLYKDGKVAWSFNTAIKSDSPPWELVLARTPQDSYYNTELFTFSKKELDIRSSISGSLSGSYSGVGWGGSIEASAGKSDAKSEQSSTMYGYAETIVPKLELRLSDSIRAHLAPDLSTSLKALSDKSSFDDYDKLKQLFEAWGAYIPLEFVIGGKLYTSERQTVTDKAQQSKVELSLRAAVKGPFLAVSASISANSTESSKESEQAKSALLQATGGDPGLVSELSKWTASLGPFATWRTCRLSRLVPIYQFADEGAQAKIFRILSLWSDYWREESVMLDFDEFVRPLERYARLRIA